MNTNTLFGYVYIIGGMYLDNNTFPYAPYKYCPKCVKVQ